MSGHTVVGSAENLLRRFRSIAHIACLALVPAAAAIAQVVPFDEASALSSTSQTVVRTFDVSTAGQYRIALTDLGAMLTVPGPAPLDKVYLLVTRGSTLVAKVDGDADKASPTDSVVFQATPGTYTVHIVGKPGTQAGSGPVGVQVTNVATSAAIASLGGSLAPPQAAGSNVRSYQADIDIPADGDYELTLADLKFPRSGTLQTAGAFLLKAGASSLTACLSVPAVTGCPSSQTSTLAAGQYQLVVAGALVDPPDGGVFSVYFRSVATGAVVHSRTVELGRVTRVGDSSTILNAADYTLSLKDLLFPGALGQVAAMVTRAAQVTALANAATPDKTFTVAASNTAYEVFAYATPEVNAGAGSYDLDLHPATGGASVLRSTQAVGSANGVPSAFTFAADVATAGPYRAQFGDFQFPAALSGSRIALVQNGTVVGKTDAATGASLSLDATLAVGRVTAIAVVKPEITGGSLTQSGGTFGLDLAATGASQPVLEATQGVGGLVSVRKVSITQAGRYDLNVSDLGYPSTFHDLMVVISRGSQKLGRLVVGSDGVSPGGGSAVLPDFEATAGNYSLTLITQPGTATNASAYGMSFAASPPAPTVTFTATPTSVAVGATVGLSWTSQGATSCTASSTPTGVWSGTKPTSGTDSSGAVNAATTFTLKCTDSAGRSTQKTASVTIATQNNNNGGSGGGGGGAFDWLTLVALTLAGGVQVARRQRAGSGR